MLIAIDDKAPRPLYMQIAAQVKDQIQRGEVQPGDELPSVRDLADSLGVNLHTVRNAYLKLREQGVIDLRLGRRARIAHPRPDRVTAAQAEHALGVQVRELVADAFLLGLSPETLHAMIDRCTGHGDATNADENPHSEDR